MTTRIGIPCRMAIDSAWSPPLVGIRRGYVDALLEAGAMPIFIPPQADEPMLRQFYTMVDGILLPGGADIAPEHYGEEPHARLGAVEPLRDRTELTLARWAVADRKPLLAICRGLQVLNVALGGTLYQDINSQNPTTIEHSQGEIQQRWDQLDHRMSLEPSSRLAELLGMTELGVNSLHHQAIKDVAPGLRVVGTAPDGIVEAVEGEGEGFVLAVQCHPEQLWQAVEPRWKRVFQALVAAAAQR